jgi:predicted nucleic acid-binding protein
MTSEWAIAELVQSVRDRAIADIFLLDGNEMVAFNRMKPQYRIPKSKRSVIHQSISDFESFLRKNRVEIVKVNLDYHKIHEYSLKYSLETPDATHVHAAFQHSCSYLVTIDKQLIDSKVAKIKVVDPGTLFSKPELRFY